jgi:hypothetical protein
MDNRIEDLKNQYLSTPVPADLHLVVRQTLHDCRDRRARKKSRANQLLIPVAAIAIVLVLLTTGINVSPCVS